MRPQHIGQAQEVGAIGPVAVQEDDQRRGLALRRAPAPEPQLLHQITPSRSFATR